MDLFDSSQISCLKFQIIVCGIGHLLAGHSPWIHLTALKFNAKNFVFNAKRLVCGIGHFQLNHHCNSTPLIIVDMDNLSIQVVRMLSSL